MGRARHQHQSERIGSAPRPRRFRVGDWDFDPSRRTLEGRCETRPLAPGCATLLDLLAGAAPEPLTRNQLLDQVWPEAVVSDHTLHELVSQLRKALGDDARTPRYIETISKLGYRLIAPVAPISHRSTLPAERWVHSLTLLTTADDRSRTPDRSASLHRALLDRLVAIPELRVLHAMTVTAGEEAADYRLEVRLDGESGHESAHARLTQADGVVIWSETFDVHGALADPLTGLANLIIRRVRLKLVSDRDCRAIRSRTTNVEAAELTCAATLMNYQINQEGEFDAELMRRQAERAAELDPGLLEAWQLLPTAYLWLRNGGDLSATGAAERSHRALAQALALDQDNATTLHALGFVRLHMDHDLDGAESCLKRAIAQAPLHHSAHWCHAMLGFVHRSRGELSQALECHRRAVRSFDSDGRTQAEYAEALVFAGRYERGWQAAETALALRPFPMSTSLAVGAGFRAQLALGGRRAATAWFNRWSPSLEPPWQFATAYMLAALGRGQEARAVLKGAESSASHYTSYWQVMAWLALNEADTAITEAARAADMSAATLMMRVWVDPELVTVRQAFANAGREPGWRTLTADSR